MDWRDYIHSDPDILVGKPVIRGTRIGVQFLLELFASGWTREQVLENYPRLSADAIQAAFAFAAESMGEESFYHGALAAH